MNTGVKSNQLNNAKKEAQQKLDSNVLENVNLKKKIDESNAEVYCLIFLPSISHA
jgi:predicted nuclease of restriction endonuclease-like (RecB) superfamily